MTIIKYLDIIKDKNIIKDETDDNQQLKGGAAPQ